jgi:hypothetical protein
MGDDAEISDVIHVILDCSIVPSVPSLSGLLRKGRGYGHVFLSQIGLVGNIFWNNRPLGGLASSSGPTGSWFRAFRSINADPN